MYLNSNVIAVTPAGRQQYMEVLAPYILREKGLVDRWDIWVNTGRDSDLAYLHGLAADNKGFVRLVHYKEKLHKPAPQPWFFRHACESHTLYIKFDDDICWVKDDAILELAKFRVENPRPLIVMANTINNGFCAYIHAKHGAQDFCIDGKFPRISPDCYNDVWGNPRIGEYAHRTFLDDLLRGDVEKYLFEAWELTAYQRFAINCICWWGRDVDGEMDGHFDEEQWLTTLQPRKLGRPNSICGTSLVSHFAFHKQRKPHCVGKQIDDRIHDAYRVLGRSPNDERAARNALTARCFI